MSLCFRTLPNKLTSFVNTRKQVTKIGRQLPKHIKSSSFLEEFLGTQVNVTKTNVQEGISSSASVYPLPSSLPLVTVNACNELSELPNRNYESSEEHIHPCSWQYRPTNINKLNNISSNMKRGLGINDIAHNNAGRQVFLVKKHGSLKNDANESLLYDTQLLSTNRILHNVPVTTDFEKQRLLQVESTPNRQNVVEQQSQKRSGGPSEEQLQHVFNVLSEDLPKLFIKPLNYEIYTPDVIFVNNIKGVTTTGMFSYMRQIALLKVVGHCRFAYVKLEVLKITMHPEDSTIKVRWRIRGISGIKVMLMFWRYIPWKLKQNINSAESWYDGFSTFHVNTEGSVFKHVVDKMMPDEDMCEKATKTPIAAKLALFTALLSLDTCSWNELCSKLGPNRLK